MSMHFSLSGMCDCIDYLVQLYTYQRSFMTKFSMVSARLEVELLTCHQRLREAFSKAEVTEAKEKKSSLDDFNSVSPFFH